MVQWNFDHLLPSDHFDQSQSSNLENNNNFITQLVKRVLLKRTVSPPTNQGSNPAIFHTDWQYPEYQAGRQQIGSSSRAFSLSTRTYLGQNSCLFTILNFEIRTSTADLKTFWLISRMVSFEVNFFQNCFNVLINKTWRLTKL